MTRFALSTFAACAGAVSNIKHATISLGACCAFQGPLKGSQRGPTDILLGQYKDLKPTSLKPYGGPQKFAGTSKADQYLYWPRPQKQTS